MTTETMNRIKVFDATIREHRVEVFVTPTGQFTATVAERAYSEPTWEGLRARLLTATRRAKVSVAVEFTDAQGRHGVLTGIHAGTDHLLVRWHGKSTSEQERPSVGNWLRRLTEEETRELLHLQKAKADAYQALEQFLKARRIDPRKAIETAVQKAVAELAAREDNHDGV